MNANQKLNAALALLKEVLEDWDENNLEAYPQELPSFDELIAAMSAIRFFDEATLTSCPNCRNQEQDTIKESDANKLVCLKCRFVIYSKFAFNLEGLLYDGKEGDVLYKSYDGFLVLYEPDTKKFVATAIDATEEFDDVFKAFAWVRRMLI